MNIESYIRQTRCFREVMATIRARASQPLLLDDLADVACMSPAHFNRTYHARIGETPMASVRRIRLALAQQQLLTGESVTRVALDSGYGSLEAFSRAYSRTFGHTPSGLVAAPLPKQPTVQIVRLPDIPVMRLNAHGNRGHMSERIARLFAWAHLAGITKREQRSGWASVDVADILAGVRDPASGFYLQAPALTQVLPDCLPDSLPGGWYACFHVRYPQWQNEAVMARRIEAETGLCLAEGRMLRREIRGGAGAPDYEFEFYFPVLPGADGTARAG